MRSQCDTNYHNGFADNPIVVQGRSSILWLQKSMLVYTWSFHPTIISESIRHSTPFIRYAARSFIIPTKSVLCTRLYCNVYVLFSTLVDLSRRAHALKVQHAAIHRGLATSTGAPCMTWPQTRRIEKKMLPNSVFSTWWILHGLLENTTTPYSQIVFLPEWTQRIDQWWVEWQVE